MARLIAERQDVVAMLGEVFRRFGYEGTSIARITAATKLGKGSLYHFFPGGKDEMAEAVLAHIQDWFETEIFTPLEDDPPGQALEAMFVRIARYFHSGRRICLVGALALEETRDRFATAIHSYFSRWLTALSGALHRGGIDRPDADRLARDMIAGIQGAIILARALDDERQFTAMIDGMRRTIAAATPRI